MATELIKKILKQAATHPVWEVEEIEKTLNAPIEILGETITKCIIKRAIVPDKVIVCDMYTADGELYYADQAYIGQGVGKNCPFTFNYTELQDKIVAE